MTDAALPLQPGAESAESSKTQSTLTRVVHYTGLRMVALFFTVLIGVYLTILIANNGRPRWMRSAKDILERRLRSQCRRIRSSQT